MWSRLSLRRRSLSVFRGNNRDRTQSARTSHRPRLETLEERRLLSGPETFQFGTSYTPVVKGYTLVAGTPYSVSLGYGWQGTNPIYENGSGGTILVPLLAGNNKGSNDTFVDNVPNGVYNVTPTLGCYLSPMTGIALTLNGQQVATNLSTAVGQFISPTYSTTVTNGQVALQLAEHGPSNTPFFWIEAMTISPVGGAAINNRPTASAGPAITANEGSSVSFSGATASGGTAPLTDTWSFGDGTTETGTLNPSYVYQLNGSYTATLTVTDADGLSSQSSTAVTINQVAPVVSLQAPSTGSAGSPISFSATATDTNPLDQAAGYTYAWSFGDGTTGTGASEAHTYNAAGTYTVSVTATSIHDGATSAAATANLVVTISGPTANAGPAITANEGSSVSFSGATASGGTAPLTDTWSFGDGTTETGTLNPSYVYQLNGSYTATLTVTDADGLSSQSSTAVTINQVAPVVSLQAPSTGSAGSPISFSATATDTNPLDQAAGYTYAWSFGDGTTGTGASEAHTYNAAGTYTVSVTATSIHDGATSAAATANLVVTISGPTANAGPAITANEGSPVSFSGATASGGTAPLTDTWSFGDGTTETGTLNPSYVYQLNGSYTATLTVTDADGLSSQSSTAVTINQVAPVVSLQAPSTGSAGSPISFSATATDTNPLDQAAGYTYAWSFGDGTTGTGASEAHTYNAAGTYTVSVTATSIHDGATSAAATANLVVTISGPTANAGPAITANEGSPVSFSGATASGGTAPLTDTWSFGDGTAETGTLNPSYVYQLNGSYTATLTVTDADGLSSQSSTAVTINQVAPVVSLQAPSTGSTGSPISFSATATDTNPLDQAAGYTYAWSFGDGTTGTGASEAHTYNAAGTYTVSVTATSIHDGATSAAATASLVITSASQTININQSWLSQQGSGPYYLTQTGATYVLQTNVSTPGTAFIALAANITFNLNGYTVNYDTQQPITVTNGGFEQGTSPTNIPGWNVTQAPGAIRVPALQGMWGNWALELPNITKTEKIASSPITIPQAGIQYAAMVTPKSIGSAPTVTLSVVDTVTGAVLGSQASLLPGGGYSPVVEFTPLTTDPVQLVVTIAPPVGQTSLVYLDNASVTRTGSYGVIATPAPWNLPLSLQTTIVNNNAQKVANFTLENGSIVQGGGDSYSASAVFAMSIPGITIDDINATASGDDTNILELPYAINAVVNGCDIVGQLTRISNRKNLYSAIQLTYANGSVQVTDNTISGTMQTGIFVSRNKTVASPITISGNTIEQNSLTTDGYGIYLNNIEDFTVTNNTVAPVNGRGLMLDTFSSGETSNGQVYGNTLGAQEHDDLEYNNNIDMEAIGMTIRVFGTGYVRDVTFTNNTFTAQTGLNEDWAAAGVRVSIDDGNTQMANSGLVFQNNTFQAVLNSIDPNDNVGLATSSAWALTIPETPAGTGLEFLNNTFASNDISVNFGDDTGYEVTVSNVLFEGDTIAELNQGVAIPYTSVLVGNWQTAVTGVQFIGTSYTGGSTSAFIFTGFEPKDVEVGWLLNLAVTNALGSAAAGDSVSLLNASGQKVFSGVTDANGDLVGIAVVTTMYREAAGNANVTHPVTTTNYGPFTVVVNQGGQQETFVIGTLTGDTNTTIKLT